MRRLLLNPPVICADQHQLEMYAEAWPVGLLQIGRLLRSQRCEVSLIDMMEYDVGRIAFDTLPVIGRQTAGSIEVTGVTIETRLLGRTFDWLGERLDGRKPPDEVWITSTLTVNHQTTRQAVEVCRRRFPGARIVIGGAYPTLMPEHAAGCGADVHVGPLADAARLVPAYDLMEHPPAIGIFRLAAGCRHNCSFCANRSFPSGLLFTPAEAVDWIGQVHDSTGAVEFSNWDPNVMLHRERLESFLRLAAGELPWLRLKFEMGIQPDRVDRSILGLMRQAGTFALTIPLESAEPERLRAFGKPYDFATGLRALLLIGEEGFDIDRCHVTSVVGYPEESIAGLFRLLAACLLLGARPTPFPITVTPRTRDARRYARLIRGKGPELLNGHLWPLAASEKEMRLKRLLLPLLAGRDMAAVRASLNDVSPRLAALFDRECDRAAGMIARARAGL